jgi:hypothetical protein
MNANAGTFFVVSLVLALTESCSSRPDHATSGCALDTNGCTCLPGPNSISCGRNQIPTDPSHFRSDFYFVTPCCASSGWPSSGSCTCENRIGVSCFDNPDGTCQCGSGGDNLESDGTVDPSRAGPLSSCSAPIGGICCAVPGPQSDGPMLACICGPAINGGCASVTVASGVPAEAVQVDRCDGSHVYTTACPDGTNQIGHCADTTPSPAPKPKGCTSDSQCASKCANECYQCLGGGCICGSEDEYGVCTF